MIEFERVTIAYDDESRAVLHDVTFRVDEGELCLVVGQTGSGKSTLLGAINGIVPHFTGGTLAGRVTVNGRSTEACPPREMADLVGVVGQDPMAGFVTDTVEEELAYGMEQLALPPDVMRKRVEETLDLLGLHDLRHRPLHQISGGQQQRVAIGAVLTAHPRILVLDEPTSALDPTASEDVLAAITRIVHDLGVTVVLAEHRLERVVQFADRVLYLPGDGSVVAGVPHDVFATALVAPPVVELGRIAGWDPLALSVRDARRVAAPLRERVGAAQLEPAHRAATKGGSALQAKGIVVRFGDVIAVRDVDLTLFGGEVTALMGRNGSGKTSLLWALQGSGRRQSGTVEVDGRDPRSVAAGEARSLIGLVPQTPADLLYLDTVDDELAQADAQATSPSSTRARDLLDRLTPGVPGTAHPRDLSEGQRLSVVLAIQLRGAPPVVLLDEPTRGLDYHAKRALTTLIDQLVGEGRCVLISTHDVEFVATAADRVVVMAEGDLVADGPTSEILTASPAFAPQVAKILAPLRVLTVRQVEATLVAAT